MTPLRPGARVVVTGATGFVGQTLVEDLSSAGYRVIGISENENPPARVIRSVFRYHSADLVRDWPDVGPFDGLVHLAGLAAVGPSFENPQHYLNVTSAMMTTIFESALKHSWQGRAVVVSSGAVYGNACRGERFTELCPTAATSPYVISKLLLESQTEYYRRRGVDAVVARPFNHIGPGQRLGFIVPDLVAEVRKWLPGLNLAAGNLNTSRDYTDVRDIARGYRLLLECRNLHYNTYNVCSGIAVSGWEMLECVCHALGVKIPPVEMAVERAIDPLVAEGSAERLGLETGWRPQIGLHKSVVDSVAHIEKELTRPQGS